MSARKIVFAAYKVQMNGKPVGMTDILSLLPMLSCGNPVSNPLVFSIIAATNTVDVGYDADLVVGLVLIAFTLIGDAPRVRDRSSGFLRDRDAAGGAALSILGASASGASLAKIAAGTVGNFVVSAIRHDQSGIASAIRSACRRRTIRCSAAARPTTGARPILSQNGGAGRQCGRSAREKNVSTGAGATGSNFGGPVRSGSGATCHDARHGRRAPRAAASPRRLRRHRRCRHDTGARHTRGRDRRVHMRLRPAGETRAALSSRRRTAQNDFRKFERAPKVLPGCDFWREKPHVGFVVLGEAMPPGGKRTTKMEVRAAIGDVEKQIAVFGPRRITWDSNDRIHIGRPDPFESIPLTLPHAHGGIDPRVPNDRGDDLVTRMLLVVDHPGLYPRNPFGRGYLVDPGPVEDAALEMPNLEDPSDLLSEERLVVRDPRLWWRQPLPWALDFVHPVTFPRIYFHEGTDAWLPGSGKTIPCPKSGGFSSAALDPSSVSLLDGTSPLRPGEASHGLALRTVAGNDTATLEGMDAEFPTIGFRLDGATSHMFDLRLDATIQRVEPKLHSIAVRVAACASSSPQRAAAASLRAGCSPPHTDFAVGRRPTSNRLRGATDDRRPACARQPERGATGPE